jgi:NAD(P)-dependent dehydrogenase (short-subunit alcohol dehydrogenase family)
MTKIPQPASDPIQNLTATAIANPPVANSPAAAGHKPVAVITGASRGLGRELAVALADSGWQLVLTARTGADLIEVAEQLSDRTTVVALAGSVVDDDHRAELAHAAALLGGADLLINNASTLAGYDLGGEPMPSLARFPLPGLLETFEVNVLAPLALTQLLLPQLRDDRGDEYVGTIINISSDAAVEPYAGWGGYGASKAAFDHASAILALEEPDLRVWAVDPGDMRTVMHQDAFPGEDVSDRPLPETVVPAFLKLLARRPPSGRYAATDLLADRLAVLGAKEGA